MNLLLSVMTVSFVLPAAAKRVDLGVFPSVIHPVVAVLWGAITREMGKIRKKSACITGRVLLHLIIMNHREGVGIPGGGLFVLLNRVERPMQLAKRLSEGNMVETVTRCLARTA